MSQVAEGVQQQFSERHGTRLLVIEESSSDPLDLVAQLLQLGDDAFPLVALNLDPPVLDRPSGAAPLLEHGGEFPHAVVIERKVEHGRHALATPARRLPADLQGDGLLGRLFRCGAFRRCFGRLASWR